MINRAMRLSLVVIFLIIAGVPRTIATRMFVQSTDNHRNGQDHETGNLASTSITVASNARLILGGLNARKKGHNSRIRAVFLKPPREERRYQALNGVLALRRCPSSKAPALAE